MMICVKLTEKGPLQHFEAPHQATHMGMVTLKWKESLATINVYERF